MPHLPVINTDVLRVPVHEIAKMSRSELRNRLSGGDTYVLFSGREDIGVVMGMELYNELVSNQKTQE